MLPAIIRPAVFLSIVLLLAGCDESDTPDFGQVRLINNSTEVVQLRVGEKVKLTVKPDKKGHTSVGEGVQVLVVIDQSGNELFRQSADIPDNTFAEYTVMLDGSVVASAGNIQRPDFVGSAREQIALENQAAFTVELFANDIKLLTVPPLRAANVEVASLVFALSFRRENGNVLFEQSIEIPKNTVIRYIVLADGTVIATGGPIERNIQNLPDFEFR